MQTAIPKVSVLLAVYNAESYVEVAIRSILTQSFKDIELILIDDGSSDGSPDILRRLAAEDQRIRLSIRPNKGIPATANEMIDQARGRYLSLMDHDDIKLPHCIEREVDYLDQHPECVAVGTLSAFIDAHGNIFKRRQKLNYAVSPTTKRKPRFDIFPPQIPSISNPSALIRADAVRAVGKYRPNLTYAHDFDLWFRLCTIGEIHQINEEHLHYRVHGENTTLRSRDEIVRHEIVVVMSAPCKAHELDDTTIINAFSGGVTFNPTITAYKNLIGHRFPMDTYILHKAIGTGRPTIANEADSAALRRRVWRHVFSWPINRPKLHLLRRMLSRYLRNK